MRWSYDGPEFTAHSHAWWYGGCPKTAVFDDYDNALRFWRSRIRDHYDPGFTYTIVDVTDWEDTLDEYFHYSLEKRPCR